MVLWVGTRLKQQHTAKRLLDNSPTTNLRSVKTRTGQLADRDLLFTERVQYIFTLKLNCTLTLTLSTIKVFSCVVYCKSHL